MDKIPEQITQILNDPGKMQQIMEMASAMGVGNQSDGKFMPRISPEMISQLSAAMEQAETADTRQRTLFQALLPYLRPRRQARLQQAMNIAQMSNFAGKAFRAEAKKIVPDVEVSNHV